MRGTLTYPRYKRSVSQLSEVWKPVLHFKEATQSHALAIQNVPNHVVAHHARARTCLVRKQIWYCKKKEKSGVSFTWNTSCTSTSWEMCWRPSMSQVSKKPLKWSSTIIRLKIGLWEELEQVPGLLETQAIKQVAIALLMSWASFLLWKDLRQ